MFLLCSHVLIKEVILRKNWIYILLFLKLQDKVQRAAIEGNDGRFEHSWSQRRFICSMGSRIFMDLYQYIKFELVGGKTSKVEKEIKSFYFVM